MSKMLRTALGAALLLVPGMAYAQEADKSEPDPVVAPMIIPIEGECGVGPTEQAPIAPEKYAISPGGVDMRAGMYKYSHTDLSIGGEGDAGISLTRAMGWEDTYQQNFGELFSHDWDIRLVETRVQVCEANVPGEYDRVEAVLFGGLGTSFRSTYAASSFRQTSNDARAVLSLSGSIASGGVFTFTANEGTKVVFRPLISQASTQDCAVLYPGRCVYASEVTKPDGTRYSLEYDTSASRKRLRSVVSSRGFALLLEYNAATADGYNLISKACVLNLAVTVKPATNLCPAGVPTAQYAYSGTFLTSATDAAGATWTQISSGSGSPRTISFYNPGQATPFVVNTMAFTGTGYVTNAQSFADGSSFSYSFNTLSSGTAGGSYTDAAGKTVSLVYGEHLGPQTGDPTYYVTPGPEQVIDALGTITRGDYCAYTTSGVCTTSMLQSWTDPEGKKQSFTYDASRNPTQIVRAPKPGSGLASLTETRAYGCGSYVCVHKPTSVTDARNNTTTYSYDTTHGGVLTETGPAVNGVSPVKRYGYAQRYAWLANGVGGYAQAASPVWLLTEERSCRTTATVGNACSGGAADEVVVSYEYGPNSGPNNLLLRGKVVSAGGVSLRSCYGYDWRGNRIWETSPRAGLAVCQ